MNELDVTQSCVCGATFNCKGKHTYVEKSQTQWLAIHHSHGQSESPQEEILNQFMLFGRDQMKTRILTTFFQHIENIGQETIYVGPDSLVAAIEIIKTIELNDDHIVPDDFDLVVMRREERASELAARESHTSDTPEEEEQVTESVTMDVVHEDYDF